MLFLNFFFEFEIHVMYQERKYLTVIFYYGILYVFFTNNPNLAVIKIFLDAPNLINLYNIFDI